jgi:putative FmdB family regulatory protein
MPLYEYLCRDCGTKFELLRGMAHADDPAPCARCGSLRTERLISLFAAVSDGRIMAGPGGCAGCSAHSCAACGFRR